MNTILSDALLITLSRYIKQGAIFVKGLLLAYFLTLEEFGEYSWYSILLTFSIVISLGVFYALNKELSINKQADMNGLVSNSLIVLTVTSTITVLLFIVYFLFVDYELWLLLALVVVITIQFNYLYENILRSLSKFKIIASVNIITGILDLLLVFCVTLIFHLSIEIVVVLYIIVVMVTNVLYISYINKNKIVKINFYKMYSQLNKPLVKKLLKSGLILISINMSYLLYINIDKMIVGFIRGNEELAIYNFAVLIVSGINVVFQSFQYIFYPKLLNYFANKSLLESWKLLKKVTIITFFIMVVLCYLASIVTSKLIGIYFDEFIPSIVIISILIFTQIFNMVSSFYNSFNIARNKESIVLKIQIVCMVFNFVFSVIVLYIFEEIYLVAIVTGITQMIYLLLSYLSANKIVKK